MTRAAAPTRNSAALTDPPIAMMINREMIRMVILSAAGLSLTNLAMHRAMGVDERLFSSLCSGNLRGVHGRCGADTAGVARGTGIGWHEDAGAEFRSLVEYGIE